MAVKAGMRGCKKVYMNGGSVSPNNCEETRSYYRDGRKTPGIPLWSENERQVFYAVEGYVTHETQDQK